uniref:ArfGAP with RhoGAP domain, ankyrin repeat and PH domain 3 n=1 Tax=Monodelphis domestica TaxID=13616 RepID=A0A5F8GCV7_MONDO
LEPSWNPQALPTKPVPKPRTVFTFFSTTQDEGSMVPKGSEQSVSQEPSLSTFQSPVVPSLPLDPPPILDRMTMMPNDIYFGLDLGRGTQPGIQETTTDGSLLNSPTPIPTSRPTAGTVHIMDPSSLYYGVQPVSVPGIPKGRKIRAVSQASGESRPSSHEPEGGEDCGYASLELPGESTHLVSNLDPEEPGDDLISPYASFTSLADPPAPVLSGWLDKLSPQGNYVFQRRFVRFNGKKLMYYGSDKDSFPKGVIPLTVIEMIRSCKDCKFQVITSQRVFVFRAESEVQRDNWCSTLQSRLKEQRLLGNPRPPHPPRPLRTGTLELRGHKAKVFAALSPGELGLYKSEQSFSLGIGICFIELRGCSVRETKNRSFDLLTPHRSFSFTAESACTRQVWAAALQEAITETLSDYEVAEKIWSNRANRQCADCGASRPDWASINLGVVICKHCAGQHRALGSGVSKVQSLKLDTSIWSNEIVQLFLILGNDGANRFWIKALPPGGGLHPDTPPGPRGDFISRKYRLGLFRGPHPQYPDHSQLLQALCTAVMGPNLLKTMIQLFSYEEPYPSPGVYNEVLVPATLSGFLHCSPISSKSGPPPHRRGRDAPPRLWCVLGAALEMFSSETNSEPISLIQPQDVVCLGVSPPPVDPGDLDRFPFSFELILTGERVQYFGTDGADSLEAWTRAVGKWFSPLSCHQLLGPGLLRLGRLRLRSPSQTAMTPGLWLSAFGLLRGDHLFLCPAPGPGSPAPEDTVHLRRLQEISVVSANDSSDKKDHLVLVETGRTLYLQGEGRIDFAGWSTAIGGAAGGGGTSLQGQQMSRGDIPIIVDACISFVTQHELPQKSQRLERYKEVIGCLPRVNHRTLSTLIGHLYRVQKCAALNQMCTRNLALLFAPSVFQTDGRGEHEVRVLQELIDNYVSVFDIDSDQVAQIDLEVSLITTWKDVQLSQAGDIIMEVYLEQQLPDNCVTLKVSPTLTAEELTNQVLEMRGATAGTDLWLTFEIREHGELERPLHPKERVLEQALQWCQLPEPGSASLLLRRVSLAQASCLFTGVRRESPRVGLLRCREEHPKLLGSRFQERFFLLRGRCLLLLKEKRSSKPEREWPLEGAKVYLGIRRKLKPPTPWGFTLILEKLQLYLSCTDEAEMWDWTTSILKAQHDDLQPVVLRRHSSSDLARQKFGTMPLLPIRGDDSGATLLSANQTLRRLHNRRTLSMFFPLKLSQDSVEEQEEEAEEPVYEEVGAFPELTKDSPLPLEWTSEPESLQSDGPLLSKSSSLGQEKGPPELPSGPSQKTSFQHHLSLEDKLLQELNSLILRKGEATAFSLPASQPPSPPTWTPNPINPTTQTPGHSPKSPCNSHSPSGQPLT